MSDCSTSTSAYPFLHSVHVRAGDALARINNKLFTVPYAMNSTAPFRVMVQFPPPTPPFLLYPPSMLSTLCGGPRIQEPDVLL